MGAQAGGAAGRRGYRVARKQLFGGSRRGSVPARSGMGSGRLAGAAPTVADWRRSFSGLSGRRTVLFLPLSSLC